MPPTTASLRPAIARSHYQCMEWNRDILPHPSLPTISNYGWSNESGKYEPVMCDLPCAPEEVVNVIKCSCRKGRCAPPCKCATQQPPMCCTEMCSCSGDEDLCDNALKSDSRYWTTTNEAVTKTATVKMKTFDGNAVSVETTMDSFYLNSFTYIT